MLYNNFTKEETLQYNVILKYNYCFIWLSLFDCLSGFLNFLDDVDFTDVFFGVSVTINRIGVPVNGNLDLILFSTYLL